MAADTLTYFSECLADPQAILSAADELLSNPESATKNIDLARCMIEIANKRVGEIAVEMEDYSD